MTLFPLRSIRARLSASFVFLIALLLLAADAGLIFYARQTALQRAEHALRQGLGELQASMVEETEEASEHRADTVPTAEVPAVIVLQELEPRLAEDEVSAVIADNHGHVWRGGIGGVPYPPQNDKGWHIRTDLLASKDNRDRYTLLVGVPWAHIEAQLYAQAALLFALTFFAVAVMGVAAWVLVGRTLRPIDQLARQAQEAGQQMHFGTTSFRSPELSAPSADAEVLRLVATLNRLLQEVSHGAEARGRFYAAASHELRTPLQVLSGLVELTLSRSRTQGEYQTALEQVGEQTDRLTALVQSLLLLDRLDRGIPEAAREPVDVPAVCARLVQSFHSPIAERDLKVRLDSEPSSPWSLVTAAPPLHVDTLVRNLVENAVRYTPSQGQVRISVSQMTEPVIRLDVFNESAPLRLSDANQLFEPFYRPDPSRNSQTGGNGLGLPICKALADANGWQLSLAQEDGGVRVTALLPRETLV